MLAPIPYLDLPGLKRRISSARPEDLDLVESLYPGYLAHRIAVGSSKINARLAKRYRVPLGQESPALVAVGTAPPPVALSGRPTLGSLEIAIEVTTPGAIGTAVVQWSPDGGITWTTAVVTAPAVPLGSTGLVASFPAATYGADNAWSASTPVPEVALGWLAAIVAVDFYARRGRSGTDPAIEDVKADRDAAWTDITEAANSRDGLYELPTNDAVGDSAVNHGGPLCYTEASPFVSADRQEREAVLEDACGFGTYGGSREEEGWR